MLTFAYNDIMKRVKKKKKLKSENTIYIIILMRPF